MTTHTPGPWASHTLGNGARLIVAAATSWPRTVTIAEVYTGPADSAVMKAAPNMLPSLKELTAYLDRIESAASTPAGRILGFADAQTRARAAIAEAEDRT